MLDLNKILPCEELETKIYVVVGSTGAGKTSYVSGRVIRDSKKNGHQRFLDALLIVQALKKNGYPNLRLDHNMYFCNDYLLLDKKSGETAWDVDFVRLGMPNEKYKVQNIPYGSVVALREGDQTANANDNKTGLNEYLRALLKYHRHNKLTIIIDLQDFSRLTKELRLLVHKVIFVRRKKLYSIFGKVYKSKWWLREIDNTYLALLNSLTSLRVEVKEKSYVTKKKFVFWGNIHDYYDDHSGLPHFLNGVDHYDYIKKPRVELTRESIEDFCKSHPLVPPEEFKKGAKNIDLSKVDESVKKDIDALTKKFKDALYEKYRKGELYDEKNK